MFKRILLFCFLVILIGCEDTQTSTKKAPNTSAEKETESTVIKQEEPKEPQREFPLLTDDNAMEFFLDYNEKNKENKVRITTDFGEIDILLYNKTAIKMI